MIETSCNGWWHLGRAIEGVHQRRPFLWPSPSSTSAVVDVGHRHGGRLKWPSQPSTSAIVDTAIVVAVDKWDLSWGACYGKKGRHKSNH